MTRGRRVVASQDKRSVYSYMERLYNKRLNRKPRLTAVPHLHEVAPHEHNEIVDHEPVEAVPGPAQHLLRPPVEEEDGVHRQQGEDLPLVHVVQLLGEEVARLLPHGLRQRQLGDQDKLPAGVVPVVQGGEE